MSDLVAFLRARLDEDEATAKANIDGGLGDTGEYGPSWPDYQTYSSDDIARAQAFLDCFRPLRVLREVEAKRAILAGLEEEQAQRLALRDSMATEGNRSYQEGYADALGDCLYRLRRQWAAVYRDHADYDEAWKP